MRVNLDTRISIVNILPTWSCNEACSHCFIDAAEKFKPAIALKTLQESWRILQQTAETTADVHVEWYGGELTTLPKELFLDYLEIIQKPWSIVTNGFNVAGDWFEILQNSEHVCTSYDSARFQNQRLKEKWLQFISSLEEHKIKKDLILTVLSKYLDTELSELSKLNFETISVLRFMIPEKLAGSALEKWKNSEYSSTLVQCRKIFGENRIFPQETTQSISNVLHILPDGRIGCPGPSELGYPYEKFHTFWKPGESEENLHKKRINYIQSQIRNCLGCLEDACTSEFSYPGKCGVKGEKNKND